MKLMLLIMPTIHSTEITKPSAPARSITPPSGLLSDPTSTPRTTATIASTIWPTSCQRARSWK